VGEQELLDLARVDVLATTDDHVLDPADDPHVARVIHRREIAGVHPAVCVEASAVSAGSCQYPSMTL
jgi:hypothetical protein